MSSFSNLASADCSKNPFLYEGIQNNLCLDASNPPYSNASTYISYPYVYVYETSECQGKEVMKERMDVCVRADDSDAFATVRLMTSTTKIPCKLMVSPLFNPDLTIALLTDSRNAN